MKIYKYQNYKDYIDAQTKANEEKISNVWVKFQTVQTIAHVKPNAKKIICHGTRNGKEQQFFQKLFPEASIIGTEISKTASNFPNTVQHDFHEQKSDWVGLFDIVYSNSWDHSYDPMLSLKTWREQLKDDGKLFLEVCFDPKINRSRKTDPLEIKEDEMLDLMQQCDLIIDGVKDTKGSSFASKLYILRKPCYDERT